MIIGCSTNKKVVETSASNSNTDTVTFDKDIKPIAKSFCGGSYCHHGEPSFWASYTNMKKIVDNGELYEEVIANKTMPAEMQLPKKEYNLIKTWLETGAKKK